MHQPSINKDFVFLGAKPEYGKDYGRGWIGFNHADSNMAKGIAYFQGWERTKDIVVSHVLVVSGENECVEAAFGKGVVRSSLTEQYFDNDERYILFRKPKGLTDDLADRIVETAEREIGTDFDNHVLVNHALTDNFLGRLVNAASGGNLRTYIDRCINQPDEWICSELAAYCLQQQPEFHDVGKLAKSLGALTPQKLFEMDELFEPLPGPGDHKR